MKLYQQIAQTYGALCNCRAKDELTDWEGKHEDKLEELCKTYMPCGSGFDAGTEFDDIASKPERLVFTTAYHHMDACGGYAGWTQHRVIISPSLAHGFTIRVTGKNKNETKEFIAEQFYTVLNQTI